MTAHGQTKKNLLLDVTLLKQQQVQVNEGLQNLQAMINGLAQEVGGVTNAQSIWLESLRLLLVEKGILADDELKKKAEEVGANLKEQARMQAGMGEMPTGPPPTEEELDTDSVDDLELDVEDYPV